MQGKASRWAVLVPLTLICPNCSKVVLISGHSGTATITKTATGNCQQKSRPLSQRDNYSFLPLPIFLARGHLSQKEEPNAYLSLDTCPVPGGTNGRRYSTNQASPSYLSFSLSRGDSWRYAPPLLNPCRTGHGRRATQRAACAKGRACWSWMLVGSLEGARYPPALSVCAEKPERLPSRIACAPASYVIMFAMSSTFSLRHEEKNNTSGLSS